MQLYGIDCEDEIIWREWQPGVESVHDLKLRNVSLVTQKLKVKLPQTKEFDMPYPESFKLAPGMEKSIPISFRPSQYEPHVDHVEVITKGGSFRVTVKAVVKDIAITVTPFIDFGLCPTCESSKVVMDVFNTGTLPANLRWHAKAPFSVRCPAPVIRVGQELRCTIEFHPKTAAVFDATLICEATKLPGDQRVQVDEDLKLSVDSEAKRCPVQVTGVGKVPHLCVPSNAKPLVEFGSVFPGNRVEKSVQVLNMTPVRGVFTARPLKASHEITPLPPMTFSVSPESGVVEPQCPVTLTFSFSSQTIKEFACQRFEITTPGGTPLVMTCTAFCRPMEVRLSTTSINFGEVPSNKVQTRTLQLHNDSDRPAVYHFINVDYMRGVFWFDRYAGIIPPESFMVVTVFFGPMAPVNYCKKVYCVVKGSASPLTLDLIGSAHTDQARPARLEQKHLDMFRNLQLSGVQEHAPRVEASLDVDADADSVVEELSLSEPQPLSATALFMEMMLPFHSKLRDIMVSAAELDFGSCSTLTMPEKQTVTVTNRTSQKCTLVWLLPGETRMPCTPEDTTRFSVYPPQCDLRPMSSMDFVVSFRPHCKSNFEGEMLEAIVYHKSNRSFRLVDLKRFTPPWMLVVRGQGHSMGSVRDDPRLEISDPSIRFRACYPGERAYQVVMISNPGDTNVSYRILDPVDGNIGEENPKLLADLKEEVPFSAWPMQGIIPPHQFHLVVLEFAPSRAKNEQPFEASFPLVVDYNDSRPKSLRVIGRAWEPRISICRGSQTVTFPPTCAGIPSSMPCEIRNASEIHVAYVCKIPSRYQASFWFEQASGQLQPQGVETLTAHFCPRSEKAFSAPVYCTASSLEDAHGVVEGPLKALMMPAPSVTQATPTYALQFVGHGKPPALSLDPESLDLGAVQACQKVKRTVTILNSSALAVHFSVTLEFVEHQHSTSSAVGEAALKLGKSKGSLAGRCTETIDLTFSPRNRGVYEYRLHLTPLGDHSAQGAVGRSTLFVLKADVQYPSVQIADIRVESATLLAQSLMWQQFQVDAINELYRGEVADEERKFQAAIGIDVKKELVKQLQPFQLLFGTSSAGSIPTVVYLVLSNPTRLNVRFSFRTPKNLNLENPPFWCEDKKLVDDSESHFAWVEDHGLFDIQPRSGEIKAEGFVHIRLSYQHCSIGTHVLPVVFDVQDGRSVLLYFKAHSVAPDVGCLSVRSPVVHLQPVPLNAGRGPRQMVELTNSGGCAAHWRFDEELVQSHNLANYNFNVLSITPSEGVLEAHSSTFVHATFTPLEAKKYDFPMRVEMLTDACAAEELCFELHAEGYHPSDRTPVAQPLFPPNLPIQTNPPVPGSGAALSLEFLDFGRCPLRARVSRMLVLVNHTSEFVLHFSWETRMLFKTEEFTIKPSSGELAPQSHCLILFYVCCQEPADVSGEVMCCIDWDHVSEYSQRSSAVQSQEEGTEVMEEYFAHHQHHPHEPLRTGKSYLAAAEQHISVANRLTVSRFRHLMSTPGGQKFLHDNLHRKALLASHLPECSAVATQPAGMGEMSSMMSMRTSKADVEPRPKDFPLHVRVRALVADWAVPREELKDFLIVGAPAAPERRAADPGVLESGVATQPEAPLDSRLVVRVLEHMLQETLADEELIDAVGKMVLQEDPYFLQFEDSPPPGAFDDHTLPREPEPFVAATARAERSSRVPVLLADEGGGALDVPVCGTRDVAPLRRDPEPGTNDVASVHLPEPAVLPLSSAGAASMNTGGLVDHVDDDGDLVTKATGSGEGSYEWSSMMLMDFPSPFRSTKGAPPPRDAQMQSQCSDGDSRSMGDDGGIAALDSLWEAAQAGGQLDLDAFKDCAGHVLDQSLMEIMDEVIGGQLNWLRPMPRLRRRLTTQQL